MPGKVINQNGDIIFTLTVGDTIEITSFDRDGQLFPAETLEGTHTGFKKVRPKKQDEDNYDSFDSKEGPLSESILLPNGYIIQAETNAEMEERLSRGKERF